MRMASRFFVAFCVATILAQGIILTLAAVRGNVRKDTLTKAIALLNGIDISGIQLQKMLDDAREVPIPTYEDVRDARALESKNLQMREASVRRMRQQTDEMLAELHSKVADFDRRKDEFNKLLEEKEKSRLDESLKDVQRTLEVLSPEQAKQQIIKLVDADHMDDVVAIVKEMSLDKRKKIMGEFTEAKEIDILHEILMKTRVGEPVSSLIEGAQDRAPID